jgi:hypothetical protein
MGGYSIWFGASGSNTSARRLIESERRGYNSNNDRGEACHRGAYKQPPLPRQAPVEWPNNTMKAAPNTATSKFNIYYDFRPSLEFFGKISIIRYSIDL